MKAMCYSTLNDQRRRKSMSRIDVVPAEKKGKFKVLVNMGMDGNNTYSSLVLANQKAKEVHAGHPDYALSLGKE